MKLQSKKARVPIAALGVTALICGAGALVSPAFAVDALTLNSGGTTPSVANLGYASVDAAKASYALKVTGSTANVTLSLLEAPTGGKLGYNLQVTNGDADTSFSTLSSSAAVNEVQAVGFTGGSGAGTFKLTYSGQTTADIPFAAAAGAVTTALDNLSNLAPGDVIASGSAGSFTLTFGGVLAGTDASQITIAAGAGATAPSGFTNTTTTNGAAAGTTKTSPFAFPDSTYLYVTGDVPGTYKLQMFQDTNTNGVLEASDERATGVITLTVYDAGGRNATTTSDDVVPVIGADSPTPVGQAFKAGITYSKPLSLSDARGNTAKGIASGLAQVTSVKTVTTGLSAPANDPGSYASYDIPTSKITYSVAAPTLSAASGSIAFTADLAPTTPLVGTVTVHGTKSVAVQNNNVDSVALVATDVAGTVLQVGTDVAVKSGTSMVTYTATAKDTGPAAVAGATVYFTVGGDNKADLTTDGTAVAGQDYVYTAITNSSGVATLKVTSKATATTDAYTVQASSNGKTQTALLATYSDATAKKVVVTSSDADLTPAVGTAKVTVAGKLTDQFGAAYDPPASAQKQVSITGGDLTTPQLVTITAGGVFTFDYTPKVAPAAGDSATLTITYDIAVGTDPTATAAIHFASTVEATTLTLTTPADAATAQPLLSSATIGAGNPVAGSVVDKDGASLAYKTVKLTGTAGVYFSTVGTLTDAASDDLVTSLTAITNASGQIQNAYVFYTKAGKATVTATSGATAKDAATVTTAVSSDPYTVEVKNVVGSPTSTVFVTGLVKDAFGNPVSEADVDLSTGTSTNGSLVLTRVRTNSGGLFSTSFIPAATTNSTTTVTGTLYDAFNVALQTADAKPTADYLKLAGLTIAVGDYQDIGTITLTQVKVTLTATAKLTGGGKAKVGGSFMPSTGVDIYSKASGAASYTLVDSLQTDKEGDFGSSYSIKKTTSFLAKSGGLSSKTVTTKVYSKVTLKATSKTKGHATLVANGSPSAKGSLKFYRSIAGKDPLLKSMTSNSSGNGTATVKLPKGTRYVYVVFDAPGTTSGASATVKVKVK